MVKIECFIFLLYIMSDLFRARHILSEGESLGGHSATAAKKALKMAGVEAKDVNLILLCTSTPDDLFGSACQVRIFFK